MSKPKDKKKELIIPKNQIRIFLFGDEEEKNKDFIRMYANTTEIIERSESFEFDKTIKGNCFPMLFYFISCIDDKIINMVKSSNGIFILFDMSDRTSFDNILDKWLIWLRDNCGVQENIFLYGDYKLIGENKSNPFLVTSEDEIQEVIECSEIQGRFCKIGGNEDDVKRQKIDESMLIVAKTLGQIKEIPEDEGGSFKKGDPCIIF